MFLYPILCLRLAACLASILLDAFAIGHQARPLLSTLRPLSRLRHTIHSCSFFDHRTIFTYNAARFVPSRTSTSHFSFPFPPTRSFLRVVYMVSPLLGLNIQNTWRKLGNCAPPLSISLRLLFCVLTTLSDRSIPTRLRPAISETVRLPLSSFSLSNSHVDNQFAIN